MPRRTIGLEIGTDAVRLCRVTGGWRHSSVDAWQQRVLPVDDPVSYRSAVVQALRGLSAEGWLSADAIVVSVPGDQVINRTVTVPFEDPAKVAQVLAYEVESLLPFDLNEVVVSPATIEPKRNLAPPDGRAEAGQVAGSRVLAVVLPKNHLAELLEMLTEAGVDPSVVEVGAAGLARFAQAALPPSDDTVAMLELQHGMTTLALCRRGRLVQFRTISAGSGDEAERETLLLGELRRTLNFYELDEQSDVSALYLCGPRAQEPAADGLITRLTDDLGLRRLEQVAPWLLPNGATPSDAAAFAQTIGLALRSPGEGLNFRQAEFMSPRERSRARTRSMGMIAVLVVAVVLGGADFFLRYYFTEQDLAAIKHDQLVLFREAFPTQSVIVNELEQARTLMKTLANRAAFLGEGEVRPLAILDHLTGALESMPELRVERLQITGGEMRFEGLVDSFESVDRVRTLLGSIAPATQVEIGDARMAADQSHVRFKVSMVMGPPAVPAGRGGAR